MKGLLKKVKRNFYKINNYLIKKNIPKKKFFNFGLKKDIENKEIKKFKKIRKNSKTRFSLNWSGR